MTENMKAFLEAIKDNEELKEKVSEIEKKAQGNAEEYLDDYIAVAKEYGITLTREDIIPEQADTAKLTDEELQAVTGGDGEEEDENTLLACVGYGADLCPELGYRYGHGCLCVGIGAAKGCGCVVLGGANC